MDKVLVENDAAGSRDRAIDLIKQGGVAVNGRIVEKPGTKVSEEDEVTLEKEDIPWVSRGALKLEEALTTWNIDPTGCICMDIGAATGGFTEVLLSYGAKKVYAVDVGKDQLAEKLLEDERVINLEKTNFKKMNEKKVKDDIDLICIDVSYISLTHILEKAKKMLRNRGKIMVLIKPQFEMEGKSQVNKGIIKETEKQEYALEKIRKAAEETGAEVKGIIDSPVKGRKGNQEFLMYMKK